MIVISVLLALWFIPLIAGLFYVGSWAITVPLFLLALLFYLVSTSMWHIHTQVERTFSRTLLGNEYISTSEAAALLGTTRSTVEKLARETRLPAIRVGKRWRISKLDAERLSEACFSGPDSCSDSADEGKVASVINPAPTPGGEDGPQLSTEEKNRSGQIDP